MNYKLLIVPFVALVAAQIIKMFIDAKGGKFSWKDIDSYGGMPSAHAAFLAAAMTQSAIQFGFGSPIFAIIAFISFVVLRDAVGLRQEVGKQAAVINQLIVDLPDQLEDKYPRLETRIGHTYPQLIVGFVLGMIIAVII